MGHELRESMDIDIAGGSKGNLTELKENGFNLYPVSVNGSGEGLPYAPEDWPNPGDKWRWKVGKRVAVSGYYMDRYMYPPKRLRQTGQYGFASKLSLKQYIQAKFPDTDVNAFFSSFSWKVPSNSSRKDDKVIIKPPRQNFEHQGSEVQNNGVHCKAGNQTCSSLTAEPNPVSEIISCDICCSEPGFCRDCCCILCCRIISKANNGYGHIRCEANIEGRICGHKCHIDCALRAYTAGTVRGSIGLDAEYYCRRCDARTDLVSHVSNLIQKCELFDSRDDIEKVLKVGICVLRGSKRKSAKQLLHQVELAMQKLKNGTCLEAIWKIEDTFAVTAGMSLFANDADLAEEKDTKDIEMGSPSELLSTHFDHQVESLKLDAKIDEILGALKKSQQMEYRLAKDRLSAQKSYILSLYQQLAKERSELSRHNISAIDRDTWLDFISSRMEQIKQEVSKLEDIGNVAKDSGRVP